MADHPTRRAWRRFWQNRLALISLAFIVRKERLIGQAVLAGYGLLAIIFIVWLGYPVANVAFGLMLSAHVTSITFLLNPWLAEARFARDGLLRGRPRVQQQVVPSQGP